jgi:hypothetical protein
VAAGGGVAVFSGEAQAVSTRPRMRNKGTLFQRRTIIFPPLNGTYYYQINLPASPSRGILRTGYRFDKLAGFSPAN